MVGEFRVLNPCARERESLAGEGAVRWCPDCRKNVHDFARMRRREVDRVVAAGGCCAIVEHRADGTLRTADPPPLRRRFLRWFSAFAGLGVRWAWAQQSPLAPGKGGLRGEVVDASGAVIADARISVAGHATQADSDGRFLFADLAPGSVSVTIESAGFVKATVQTQVAVGKFTTLAPLKLRVGDTAMGGSIVAVAVKPTDVVVTDQTGAPIPNAHVTLHDSAAQVVKELHAESSPGRYSFGVIEPGAYTLTVECPGFKKYRQPVSAPSTQVVLEVGSVGGGVVVEPINPLRRLVNRLRR